MEGGEVVGVGVVGADPKRFVIVQFEGGAKSAALVEQVCSIMWDFYNGYIRFCKTYTIKDIYTVQWAMVGGGGLICRLSQTAEYCGLNASAQ